MSADVLGAHARLAAIESNAGNGGLLDGLLEAMLLGAGVCRGLAIDPAWPDRVSVRAFTPDVEALACFSDALRGGPRAAHVLPGEIVSRLFPGVADARAIPVTAGDELLALVVLEGPLVDPIGFASVTAHAASLLARIRWSEKVSKADFELKYRVWELESLYDVGLSIARTLDLTDLADEILMKSVSLLNARAGTLIVEDFSGDGRVLVKDFGGVLVGGDAMVEIPEDGLIINQPSQRAASLAGAQAEKLLAVPIKSEGRRVGLLVVADKENRAGGVDDFNESDRRILLLFGNQAAIALENARLHREAVEKERMEREIELAASIQKTILPDSLPAVPGLELAGANRPTRQVGGDYFDVIPLPNGRTAFWVADVSGKGVPAALLVSTLHACLHLLVEAATDSCALVARINKHLLSFSSTRKFVTLFFAVYDSASRELCYVNAGHNPGLWISGERLELLPSTGLPIGMLPNVSHKSVTIGLGKSDLVVLYSDGITEALDGNDLEFGMERFSALVLAERARPPAEISDRIFAAVAEFTRGVAQYDDQTVLVARAL